MNESDSLSKKIGFFLVVVMCSMIGYELGGWLGALIGGTLAGLLGGPAGIMIGFGVGTFYSGLRMAGL